jgi:hypothetical protein
MATYAELFGLRRDDALRNRVSVAVTKKAQALLDGSPTTIQATWAAQAIRNPTAEAERLLNYVLAANSGASIAAIQAATDAAIQTNINAAVDALIAAGVVD